MEVACSWLKHQNCRPILLAVHWPGNVRAVQLNFLRLICEQNTIWYREMKACPLGVIRDKRVSAVRFYKLFCSCHVDFVVFVSVCVCCARTHANTCI